MFDLAYSELCRQKDPSLPKGWQVYMVECLPVPKDGDRDWKCTHIRLVGAVPRLLKSGPRKDQKTWRDKVHEKEFIVPLEEYRAVSDRIKPEKCAVTVQQLELV